MSKRGLFALLAGGSLAWCLALRGGMPLTAVDRRKNVALLKTAGGNLVGATQDEAGRLFMFDQRGNLYYDTEDPRLGMYMVSARARTHPASAAPLRSPSCAAPAVPLPQQPCRRRGGVLPCPSSPAVDVVVCCPAPASTLRRPLCLPPPAPHRRWTPRATCSMNSWMQRARCVGSVGGWAGRWHCHRRRIYCACRFDCCQCRSPPSPRPAGSGVPACTTHDPTPCCLPPPPAPLQVNRVAVGNISDLRTIDLKEIGGVPVQELQKQIKGLRGGR